MRRLLPALVALAALAVACGDEDEETRPASRAEPTISVRAISGEESRLLGPTSTCGEGAPEGISLACGIPAPHPRVEALPARAGEPIELRFEADVDRLLAQRQAAGSSGPVVDVTQLRPVPSSGDPRHWTLTAPSAGPKSVVALVALFEKPVFIRNLATGATAPIEHAVLQYQLPLAPAR
ncbi:MAG TPA: hypothetical protein VF587_04110 [Solirubrobacteraceae bacterium]|jgi:hypothetical protein